MLDVFPLSSLSEHALCPQTTSQLRTSSLIRCELAEAQCKAERMLVTSCSKEIWSMIVKALSKNSDNCLLTVTGNPPTPLVG